MGTLFQQNAQVLDVTQKLR